MSPPESPSSRIIQASSPDSAQPNPSPTSIPHPATPDAPDYSDVLHRLITQYRRSAHPLPVNFRQLAPFYSGIDRATHLLHSYPAKLFLNIPFFFLHCHQLGLTGHLLDPFCGSGTVLLEGALKGWRLTGADANPLARLITKAKLTPLPPSEIDDALTRVCLAPTSTPLTFHPVVDVNHWFSPSAQRQIGHLLAAIDRHSHAHVRNFLRVCLSSCLRKLSFADPRLSVPVRAKTGTRQWSLARSIDLKALFRRTVATNRDRLARLARLAHIDSSPFATLQLLPDARLPTPFPTSSLVDLAITSPPYVGAQKYIRSSSFSIGWLGLAPGAKLRPLERLNIGREHYPRHHYNDPVPVVPTTAIDVLDRIRARNPLRAHIASVYLNEMRHALATTVRRIRSGGHLVLVIGNNTVAGQEFLTSQYLTEIVLSLGLALKLELIDDIRSRGLMTKRNRTAGVIDREHIAVFAKP